MLGSFLYLAGTLLGLSLAFRLIERLRPVERGHGLGGWALNVAYGPVLIAFAFLIGPVLGVGAVGLAAKASGGLLPAFDSPARGWGAGAALALGYAFLWDLWQYASHRLLHGVPWLWETHRFHHDDAELSAATQTRVHVLSYSVAFLFYLPVVMLFGIRPPSAVGAFLTFTLWGFVNHANLRLSFGPLTPVISGPQWHRIHHSILPEHQGRNFATLFPVIDLLFGTYYRPARDEYPPTGVAGPRATWLEAATYGPVAGWRRLARGERSGAAVRDGN